MESGSSPSGRRGVLLAPPRGAQALYQPSTYPRLKRGRKGRVLRYLGRSHQGPFAAALTRLVRQCLATGGLTKRYRPPAPGFCPKVHRRRCGSAGRDRRPARHDLGTRHPALNAARFVGLRGYPRCAAGQERRRGAQVLRRQPSAALSNANQRLLRPIPQPSTSTNPACSPRTLGPGKEKRYSTKLCVGGMSESAYPSA